MTSNQTIDGVPRELLKMVEMTWRQASGFSNKANDVIAKGLGELRALLDAPAYPNRLCHIDYTAHPYICGCLKGDEEAQRRFDEHHGKAAQPQGEPVAWICHGPKGSGLVALQWSHLPPPAGLERKIPLRAEQLAPVSVASRDESIAWLKRIDGIGQNRAELIYSMGFRRHTEVPQY